MSDSRVVYYLMYQEELRREWSGSWGATHIRFCPLVSFHHPQYLGYYPHDPKMAVAAPDTASSAKSSNHLKSYVAFENG